MYSFKRILATLLNNSDQNISGEEYTGQVSATVANLAARGFEEVENIGGTAIALIGYIAKDAANFTYFQGKPLFFKAATKSAGAASIDIAGKGEIPIKDAKGGVITKDSWQAGELVCGIIYNNQFIVFVNSAPAETIPDTGSIPTATRSIYQIEKNEETQTDGFIFATIPNVQGNVGEFLSIPRSFSMYSQLLDQAPYTELAEKNSFAASIGFYKDAAKVQDLYTVSTVGMPSSTGNQWSSLAVGVGADFPSLNGYEFTDTGVHDYSFKLDITAGSVDLIKFKASFNGVVQIIAPLPVLS